MVLSKRQKLLLAVASVAVAGWALDALVLRQGQATPAPDAGAGAAAVDAARADGAAANAAGSARGEVGMAPGGGETAQGATGPARGAVGSAPGGGRGTLTGLSADGHVGWGARSLQARLLAATRPLPPVTTDPFLPEPAAGTAASAVAVAPEPEAATSKGQQPIDLATAFTRRHTLRAVIAAEGGGIALVDDRMVRIGEGVGGFRLVAIETNSAIFEHNGLRVRLTAETQLSDPPPPPQR